MDSQPKGPAEELQQLPRGALRELVRSAMLLARVREGKVKGISTALRSHAREGQDVSILKLLPNYRVDPVTTTRTRSNNAAPSPISFTHSPQRAQTTNSPSPSHIQQLEPSDAQVPENTGGQQSDAQSGSVAPPAAPVNDDEGSSVLARLRAARQKSHVTPPPEHEAEAAPAQTTNAALSRLKARMERAAQ
jgi:hypothetical protein